jgi:hypothetical protein
MDNKLLNITRCIIDLPYDYLADESISLSIIRIIYGELRPIISNAVILWNNQANSDEFYPPKMCIKQFSQ